MICHICEQRLSGDLIPEYIESGLMKPVYGTYLEEDGDWVVCHYHSKYFENQRLGFKTITKEDITQ